MRNCSVIKALREDGHKVSLISFQEPEGLPACGVKEWCEEATWVGLPPRYWWTNSYGRVRALLSGLPFGVVRFRSKQMAAAVAHRLCRGDVDAVLCDDVYVIANLGNCDGTPLLLNKASMVFEETARFAASSRNPAIRAYAHMESRLLRRWEKRSCSVADLVLTCSERDRGIVQSLGTNNQAYVVPNAVDLNEYELCSSDDGRTAVFAGAMDWYPNQDAVAFFAAAVLPKLRRLAPRIEFLVAGRNPPLSLQRSVAMCEQVRFTGTVPDMRPILRQAAVCVVPLRIGSGTRMKILEAAAMGKAIVSTSVGAEGLEFENGDEIMIADRPEDFAEAVAQLLKSQPLRDRIGRAARRRVRENYGIEAVKVGLRNAFRAMSAEEQFVDGPIAGQEQSPSRQYHFL
jgi:glycosyltransferase involved in cell wall biosynthesis